MLSFPECFLNGTTRYCNCSPGYTWSNNVCYNYSCCTEASCSTNVSDLIPLCIPKVNGNGSLPIWLIFVFSHTVLDLFADDLIIITFLIAQFRSMDQLLYSQARGIQIKLPRYACSHLIFSKINVCSCRFHSL